MATQAASYVDSSPRTFAEFEGNRSWHDIGVQVRRLDGAIYLGFTSDRRDASMRFTFHGQDFRIKEDNRRFAFAVEDSNCPERILWEVQSHFAALLSPSLTD
jgi:hypothetical protein